MEPHVTATGCHLPYGITVTQCYLSADTSEYTSDLVYDMCHPLKKGQCHSGPVFFLGLLVSHFFYKHLGLT